jgi:primosomal protein N' (replication factor Y) (superfamily II helicase)
LGRSIEQPPAQVEQLSPWRGTLPEVADNLAPTLELRLRNHGASVSSVPVFARVVLPTALPDALSYLIPDELDSVVAPGHRVRVQLRGHSRVGLVVGRVSDPGIASERVRAIDEALDAEPFVPAHVLDLVAFVADYYAAPIGTVVRTAIPPALLRVPAPMIEAGARAREVLGDAVGPQRELLERLLVARRVSFARLQAEGFPAGRLRALLVELSARNAVKVIERGAGQAPGTTVAAVALTELATSARSDRVGRAPAQRRVLAFLVELGRPVLEAELIAACGCSAGVVSELERKGVVRRFRQYKERAPKRWELAPPPPPQTLTAHQQAALTAFTGALGGGNFRGFLLSGVTGSGKTEVYLRLVAEAVARGSQGIVLVPEIGLTPALAGHLAARFGDRVAVLHSSMAEGERAAAWERARRGQVDVVAGPRSAVWAPLPRLGVIVVDEEQDASYKQEEEPRYHARDVALVLAQRLGIPAVLVSATPSLETLMLGEQGRLEVLDLPERVAGGRLPEVEVVDLCHEPPEAGEHGQRFLSRRLLAALGDTLARGEQAILLVNRRGWAPVLLCRECGHQASCQACSVPMTVHRRLRALMCHYCGARRDLPAQCPRCGGEVLDHVGAGTEKIANRVRELFPSAAIDILDRDTARSPAQLLATLERFSAGATQILVGTQMVSKGHHFPAVTLTGVVNADNLLGFPDFRGAERTFQMLTQVAGRAGRGERPGVVIVQSYHPDHHAVSAALAHDLPGFSRQELAYRRAFRYPPATRLVLVRYESERESAAVGAAAAAVRSLEPTPAALRVVGPAPAPIAKLRGRWRVQMLLLAATRGPLREAIARIAALPLQRGVHRVIDVDPQSTV